MATIAVIDYGMGNLRSVAKALEFVSGARTGVTADPDRIRRADRVVFPGQGAIRDCIGELQRLELADAIRELVRSKPFLGICIGMQALLRRSEENGGVDALGIYQGEARHFRHVLSEAASLKIPHMGWNRVRQTAAHPLWRGIDDGSRFYFVHSYYAVPEDAALTAGTSDYGISFTAALGRGNVFATQFHPEKSQRAGLDLLANFARWDGTV
jgi:glutamine amidotransferase